MSAGAAPERRAPFIAFEGIEGCGKSTQIARLAARLEAEGRTCHVTREPGGTPLGEALRRLLLDHESEGMDGWTELFLLAAGRRQHVARLIRPALSAGKTVIADRFADSSVAYQGGGRELGVEAVERINRIATAGWMPDFTILLDLSVAESARRVADRPRAEDRMERERATFHERVRQTYLELARRRGAAYLVLDAAQDEEALAEEIAARVAVLY